MVAGLEIWVMVFLKIVFAILGCAFVVTRITPLAKSFIRDSIKGQKAVAAFIYIINVFIIFYTIKLVLGFLPQLDVKAVSYLLTIRPALDVVSAFFHYVQWILVAVVFVVALNYLSKRQL